MLHRRTCDKRQSSGSRGRAGGVRRLRRLRGRQPRTRRRLGALSCADTSGSHQHVHTVRESQVDSCWQFVHGAHCQHRLASLAKCMPTAYINHTLLSAG